MYYVNQLDEPQLRELAKTNVAKAFWASSKYCDPFGIPASQWTDEQNGLISWLNLYDSIQESVDCPPHDIVTDDILLDGWLTLQSRKRDREQTEKLGKGFGKHNMSGKPGIQEVFLPADTPEDAQRIHDMNDTQSRFEKRQREKLIASKGAVGESEMPDSQLLMRQQALQEILDRSKKK